MSEPETDKGEELFQAEKDGNQPGSRMEARGGLLHVVDSRTGRVFTSKGVPDTAENREHMAQRLLQINAEAKYQEAPGSLRAVNQALEQGLVAEAEDDVDAGGGIDRDGSALPSDGQPQKTRSDAYAVAVAWILGTGVDLLIKVGGRFSEHGQKVKDYCHRWNELNGQLGKPIRDILDPLKHKERRAVLDEFVTYMHARESKEGDA